MPAHHLKPRTYRDIANIIVGVLGTVGFLSVALVAPNALQLFGPEIRKGKRRISSWEVNRSLDRLARRGYVQYRRGQQGERAVGLTSEGARRFAGQRLENIKILEPKKWDGKWRLVFFDIPHAERHIRTAVRRKLQELGFYQLQKSVYLHPFECFDVIRSIQDFYRVRPYVYYAVVDRIEGDGGYRRYFNLRLSV